jgi:MYXO-CTERM domain-containing protein
VLSASALVLWTADASAQVVVAVEDGSINGTGSAIAAQLNNDTFFNFTATVVTAAQIDTAGEIAPFDVVILGDSGNDNNDHTQGMATALATAVQNTGLGVVTVGWIDYSTQAVGPDVTLDTIMPMDASPYWYDFCGGQSSINIPNPSGHPVTTGLPTSFLLTTSANVEYNNQMLDATNASVLGTVTGFSCNPATPRNTIIVGELGAGRLVYLGPVYMANTSYNNTDLRSGNPDRLLEQACNWAAGTSTVVDSDNDGVPDSIDPNDANPNICGDVDADGCDDCTIGVDGFGPLPDSLPNNDGPDFDADGQCNTGDPDDDNDGVSDGLDPNDANPDICSDIDADTCEDCSVGTDNLGPLPDQLPNNDGPDVDSDGDCDLGDIDDDNDGTIDANDPNATNPNICGDSDADGCDDCAIGVDGFGPLADSDPTNDGPDLDMDGQCDLGDNDSDADNISDADEGEGSNTDTDGDLTPDYLDLDSDGDGLNDIDEAGDTDLGTVPIDTDVDGMPNFQDTDSDNDTVLDGVDNCILVANMGQEDVDMDGIGDACEDDDDGDGILDTRDNCPMVANPGQEDTDMDGIGDACDSSGEGGAGGMGGAGAAGGPSAGGGGAGGSSSTTGTTSGGNDDDDTTVDDGCGCSVPGAPRPNPLGLALLIGAAAFLGRRRRR